MREKIKQLVREIRSIYFDKRYYKEYLSYAQAGEDKVVEILFLSMGIPNFTYLEIGTNNPIHFNNTYLFYLKGSRGVCIEANPTLIADIKKYRPQDVCLNVGIAKEKNSGLDFYIFDDMDAAKGLSTFSKEEADYIEATTPIKIAKIKTIPVITINEVLQNHFSEKAPDYISIDVEGLDLDILMSMDFKLYRPVAICVETVSFSMNHKRPKRTDIIDFMSSVGYFVYAETGLNSIFADKNLF